MACTVQDLIDLVASRGYAKLSKRELDECLLATLGNGPTPVATAATAITTTSFSANWQAFAGSISFRLDVATDGNFVNYVPGFQNLNVGNVTTYSVTGLTPSTQYYYRVRVVTASGTSANSNVIWPITLPVPANAFAYTPDTSIITWNDVNGNGQQGDLAAFNAAADKPTVTHVDFTAVFQDISSVTNIQDLPALQTFDMPTATSCTVLDFHGLTALTTVDLGNPNNLETLNFAGCSALTSVDCSNGPVATLNLTGCTSLTTVDCSSTALSGGSALTVTGCISLASLICSNNDLNAIAGLSTCTSLTTFNAHDNSFVTLNLNFMPAHVNTIDVSNNPNLTTLAAANVVDTQGDLNISATGIVHASFPALASVGLAAGNMNFRNCTAMLDFSAPNLASVGGDFTGDGNTAMTSMTLASLGPGGVVNFRVNGCTSLTAVSIPTGGFICSGDFLAFGCTSMVTASFGAGADFGSGLCDFHGNTSMISFSASGTTFSNLDCSGNTSQTSISVSGAGFGTGAGAGGNLNCSGMSALTTLTLGAATFADNGETIDFTGCALLAGDATHGIEGLLRRLIVSGVTTLTVDCSGGTSAGFAALSVQGQTDFNDLNTLGNSVTLNP